MDFNLNKPDLPWLDRRTILLGPSGSYAAGTNTENSDRDYRGVCIPPMEYYLGLESFNEYNNTGGKNWKNTRDDVDVSVMHINKFVRDAMAGAPNSIDLLFLRPQDYLKITQLGRLLLENRHLFLTKAVKGKFAGFANGQVKLMTNKGYDPKAFMQAVKMLTGVIEILRTGDYCTYRHNREFLLDCRNGKYTLNEALEILKHFDVEMQEAYTKSELPDKPDYTKINALLITINGVAIQEGGQHLWEEL